MRSSLRLGRLFGIEILIHYSWLIIAFLVVFSLAGHFQLTNPAWSTLVVWAFAVVTAALFFASIVVHELSHSAVAKSRGIPVRSITLFALGGIAGMEKESSDAKSEFWIAVVGPITSIVIGIVFLGLALLDGWRPELGTPASPLWAGLVWLGYINIALGVFNLIPGYPLDGGRILRSIVWSITGNMMRATRIAAAVGEFIAIGFIVLGLFRFFSGAGIGGLWLAFIGWFLSQAASASYEELETTTALGEVRVGDVMTDDCPRIDGDMDLRTFAEDYLLRTGRRCFIVAQGGRDMALITVHELKQVPRERWPFKLISDIARPIESVRTVSPETGVKEALDLMVRDDVNQLPVVVNGRLAGVISRGNVLQFLKTRGELKAA
ncbi:MAG TPA: site-2 protease family protein [Terriglobia bacterium]|nr:site-2 protease family protein [Terriglobia bacterium]